VSGAIISQFNYAVAALTGLVDDLTIAENIAVITDEGAARR